MQVSERVPLPGEADAEEVSPYLRRQRTVTARRTRVTPRVRWVLFALLALLLMGCGGYYVATFALASPRFVLSSTEDVGIDGNRYVPREEILNALGFSGTGVPGGRVNIFRLSLREKREQVESIPWVRSATLMRAYPHRLAVQVVERTPVAFVNLGGRLKLVDGEGVLLEKPERVLFDFPVLKGLDAETGTGERRARLALYEEFTRQLASEASPSGWLISEVDLADGDDLKALLVQGRETIQVHFGHKDFLERFRSFLALLPEMRKTNARIDSVDLRYRNQVVVNPEPVAPGKAGDAGRRGEPDTRKD